MGEPWTPQYWYLDRYPTWVECEWPTQGTGVPFTTGYGSQRSIIADIDVWTPNVGTGSLWLQRNLSGTRYHVSYQPNPHTCWVQWWNDDYEVDYPYGIMPGCSEGYAQSVFQVRKASGSGRHQLGLLCLCSTDGCSEVGTCYALMLDGAQNALAWEALKLLYYPGPNGLRDTPVTLASMPFTAPLTSLVPIELRWIYKADEDSLALYGQLGTAVDYSDLALVLEYAAQPAVVTGDIISQGIGMVFNFASFTDGAIEARVDNTVIRGAYFVPPPPGV